jgi:hypothetical protein
MTIVSPAHESGIPDFEYSEITPLVSIGTNQCCADHFKEELLAKGYAADISLEKERLDAPFGASFFLWLPTVDHSPPTLDQLSVGTSTLHHLIEADVRTYVHCKNGHGRAPTLVAAYLIRYQDMSPEDAVATIRNHRPSIHLEESQIAALKNFVAQN